QWGVAGGVPQDGTRSAELRGQETAAAKATTSDQDRLDEELVVELVPKRERFAGPTGTLSDVRARLAFARGVRAASIDSQRGAWGKAIASIASRHECPPYNGLQIAPQLGLVPIGRDPDSGLWEFAHLQSGHPATRDSAGRLRVTDSTGIVLVLVPGGRYFMGATGNRSALPAGSNNLDPHSREDESPVNEVSLDPFFISK